MQAVLYAGDDWEFSVTVRDADSQVVTVGQVELHVLPPNSWTPQASVDYGDPDENGLRIARIDDDQTSVIQPGLYRVRSRFINGDEMQTVDEILLTVESKIEEVVE